MQKQVEINREEIQKRRDREIYNVFSRLPAIYAASRTQGQRILQIAGGLSIVEWRTLWDLYEAGPMSIRDLAKIQSIDHSVLSRALPAMRKKGYVTTHRDEVDGRQTIVKLAEAGRAAYEFASPFMTRRREALRENFSEQEIATLIALFDRLAVFFDQPIDDILKDVVKQ